MLACYKEAELYDPYLDAPLTPKDAAEYLRQIWRRESFGVDALRALLRRSIEKRQRDQEENRKRAEEGKPLLDEKDTEWVEAVLKSPRTTIWTRRILNQIPTPQRKGPYWRNLDSLRTMLDKE